MTNNEEYLTTSDLMQNAATTIIKTALDWSSGKGDAQDAIQAIKVAGWQLETAQRALVTECRGHGWTWAEIGEWLGTSRQAAQQRFGA
jgi:DNA-directed RNA polymerase specialized sigma24 family protein